MTVFHQWKLMQTAKNSNKAQCLFILLNGRVQHFWKMLYCLELDEKINTTHMSIRFI